MNATASWFLLLLVGILLVIIGVTGSAGKLLAVAFSPALLEQIGTDSVSGTNTNF